MSTPWRKVRRKSSVRVENGFNHALICDLIRDSLGILSLFRVCVISITLALTSSKAAETLHFAMLA
jgi:hypothetical protein